MYDPTPFALVDTYILESQPSSGVSDIVYRIRSPGIAQNTEEVIWGCMADSPGASATLYAASLWPLPPG